MWYALLSCFVATVGLIKIERKPIPRLLPAGNNIPHGFPIVAKKIM